MSDKWAFRLLGSACTAVLLAIASVGMAQMVRSTRTQTQRQFSCLAASSATVTEIMTQNSLRTGYVIYFSSSVQFQWAYDLVSRYNPVWSSTTSVTFPAGTLSDSGPGVSIQTLGCLSVSESTITISVLEQYQ